MRQVKSRDESRANFTNISIGQKMYADKGPIQESLFLKITVEKDFTTAEA
jgi:hypothetical protein